MERSDLLGGRAKVEESVQMYSEQELKGILTEQVSVTAGRYRKGTILQFLLEYHTMAGNTPGIVLSTIEDILDDYGFSTRPPVPEPSAERRPPEKNINIKEPMEKIRGKPGKTDET